MFSIVLDDAGATPHGNEPVCRDGVIIGKTTSAAFGYRVGSPVALADLDPAALGGESASQISVDIAGQHYPGRLVSGAVFDPSGKRMRTT